MRIVPKHRGMLAGQLPMTSMIDVVFLLLIFFMVTSNFASPEDRLAAGLQAEGRGARTQDLQPQVVEVRRVGAEAGFVIGSNVARSRADLTRVLRSLPREQGVIIKVWGDVPVAAAAAAMQAAADAGFSKRTYVPAEGG